MRYAIDIPDAVFDAHKRKWGVAIKSREKVLIRELAFLYQRGRHTRVPESQTDREILVEIAQHAEALAGVLKRNEDGPYQECDFIDTPLRLKVEDMAYRARKIWDTLPPPRRGPKGDRLWDMLVEHLAKFYERAGGEVRAASFDVTADLKALPREEPYTGGFFEFVRDIVKYLPEGRSKEDAAIAKSIETTFKRRPYILHPASKK